MNANFRAIAPGLALAAVLTHAQAAQGAQGPSATGARIFVCTDATGKRITSDRPIPECLAREHRVLNPDGSTRALVAPPMTASERAAKEARDRELAVEETARLEAMRVDRLLLSRFPDEAAHQRAREAALNSVRESAEVSRRRMAVLALERKAALTEAEFYTAATLPPKLRYDLSSNEAAAASQRTLIQSQEAEAERINARFDVELERLRRLWAGAAAGSLGTLHAPNSPGAGAR